MRACYSIKNMIKLYFKGKKQNTVLCYYDIFKQSFYSTKCIEATWLLKHTSITVVMNHKTNLPAL